MNENGLETACVRAVKRAGGIAYKFVSPSHNGVPDRLVVFPGGRVSFAEIKAPTGRGRLSERQKKEIHRLTALGCRVRAIASADDIRRMIQEESVR